MPPIEEQDLHQKAVLWPKSGNDLYGQPAVGAPVDLDCRWINKRRQMVDSQGNLVSVDASAVVIIEIEPGSTMWLAPDPSYAATEQWYGTGSAGEQSSVMEVVAYEETPDISNRVVRRTVGLNFYKDTLPEQT